MSDLISRQEAIMAVVTAERGTEGTIEGTRNVVDCVRRIKELPSADTDLSGYSDKLWRNAYERGKAEPKKGKWKKTKNPQEGWVNLICPFCKKGMSYYELVEARPNFCIHCGADMRATWRGENE